MTMTKFRIGLLIAAIALVVDQACKILFLYGFGWISTLPQQGNDIRIEVLPFFNIVMVWNPGISYGLLPAASDFQRWILVAFAVGVTSLLIWWLRTVQELRLAQAIGLIIGGAVGNVIDRIAYGKVADFFHLHAFGYNWYVFNLADAAVVMGVAIMAFDLVQSEWRSRTRGAKEDQT